MTRDDMVLLRDAARRLEHEVNTADGTYVRAGVDLLVREYDALRERVRAAIDEDGSR